MGCVNERWENSIRSAGRILKAAIDRKTQENRKKALGRGLGVQLKLGNRAARSWRLCWLRRD